MRVSSRTSLSLFALTACVASLTACSGANTPPDSNGSRSQSAAGGGSAADHSDDEQLEQLLSPANDSALAFRTAEMEWQSDPDPDGGSAALTTAAGAAADAHHQFAEAVARANWSAENAEAIHAVGEDFASLADAFDGLADAQGYTEVAVGECHVSVAFLDAVKQYLNYVEQVTGNPPIGGAAAELPSNEASARMCKYRVPLLKASGRFNTIMSDNGSNGQAQAAALSALAKAEDAYVKGIRSEDWPAQLDSIVDELLKAYTTESRLLTTTEAALVSGTQKQVDAAADKLQKSYARTQAAENALGPAIVALAPSDP